MTLRRMILAGIVMCLPLTSNSQTSGANQVIFKSIYTFAGGSDGAGPTSGLTSMNGAFYGTTYFGGGSGCGGLGCGTVFALLPPVVKGGAWTESVLYSFAGGNDGSNPFAGLTNVNGTLYGTTSSGGGTDCPPYGSSGPGCGTVFALSPPAMKGGAWTENVLYSFAGGSDGSYPQGGLIDVTGTLYGTTTQGGSGLGCFLDLGCGTIFTFNLDTGTETVLHEFEGSDGSNPVSGLLNVGSTLYGTTYRGGAGTGCILGYGCGTAFKINKTTGVLTVLHSFSANGSDGASPQGTLINAADTLYGTTDLDGTGGCPPPYGCGTAFAMNPSSGVVTPLHEFTGASDGQHPTAAMLYLGGILYGTTQGGTTPNTGAVFQLNLSTLVETVLYEFSGSSDGASPIAPLINVGGAFYSTTQSGGTYGYGTVYEIRP